MVGNPVSPQKGPAQLKKPALSHLFSNEKRNLHRLLVIETWIHLAAVIACQIRFGKVSGSTNTLGDVFPGEFQMDSGKSTAHFFVDAKRGNDLRHDVIKRTCFDSIASCLSVAMHRITAPQDFASGTQHRLGQHPADHALEDDPGGGHGGRAPSGP